MFDEKHLEALKKQRANKSTVGAKAAKERHAYIQRMKEERVEQQVAAKRDDELRAREAKRKEALARAKESK